MDGPHCSPSVSRLCHCKSPHSSSLSGLLTHLLLLQVSTGGRAPPLYFLFHHHTLSASSGQSLESEAKRLPGFDGRYPPLPYNDGVLDKPFVCVCVSLSLREQVAGEVHSFCLPTRANGNQWYLHITPVQVVLYHLDSIQGHVLYLSFHSSWPCSLAANIQPVSASFGNST